MEEVSGPPGVPRGPRAWAPGFTRVLRPCRVSDSDDLVMTESEVGRVALRIEKELFSLFHVTDNRYKSKYRSLMFNLKDPKNQGLFHRVLREEISLAKLVRMKPEELVSKELSMWKERPTRPVSPARVAAAAPGVRLGCWHGARGRGVSLVVPFPTGDGAQG